MDKTPSYVRMCEAAEEVQAMELPDSSFIVTKTDVETRVHMLRGGRCPLASNWTWLPTQRQLQDMVYHKHPRWIGLLLFFGDWLADETSSEDETSTPEQLWLRYTMSALYNKFWNGFKWERDPKFEMFEKKED